jgi:hypothetical protein
MCDCIEKVNEALKKSDRNTILDIPLGINFSTGQFSDPRIMIATCKEDPKIRKGPIKVQPSFCPFCGKEYPKES